jgi:hypothetical protein
VLLLVVLVVVVETLVLVVEALELLVLDLADEVEVETLVEEDEEELPPARVPV